MPDEKKNYVPYKGNRVKQEVESNFIENFTTWRSNCEGVSNGDLKVKSIPNLYVMLKNHMKGNIREKSRNESLDGQGAIQFLEVIEDMVDGPELFTNIQAKFITEYAKRLAAMEKTGEDAGGTGPAFDPAFILFTEQDKTPTGEKLAPRTVQGHYATEWYSKRNGVPSVPGEWMTGNNPPHEALFSETSGPYSKPKGLLHIMLEAAEAIPAGKIEVEIETLPSGTDAADIDELSAIEDFFNKVVREETYWSAGGKLLVDKVRRELATSSFNLSNKDQAMIRELANLGSLKEKEGLAGRVTNFKLMATATPIITLTNRALKRKNTIHSPVINSDTGKGFRAWQNKTKRGFDYRQTAREAYGITEEDYKNRKGKQMYKPDSKITKMWQHLLWRN